MKDYGKEISILDMPDLMEIAKHGTPVPGREDIVRISEHQYYITSIPNNRAIINTSQAFKTKEENQPLLDFLSEYIGREYYRQELAKYGIDIDDLTKEDWAALTQ